MELNGTVSIVTGGNGGLGQRICVALAAAGSKVAVVYAASREQAEAFAAELRADGAEAEAFQCDVSDPAQVESLVSNVEARLGGPDILVNDAAYNKMIQFDDLDGLTYEEWCKILDINLTGPMLTTKAVAPGMREARAGPDRQHLIDRGVRSLRVVHRLRGIEGRAEPPDAVHGGRAGAGDPGELHRARPPGGHEGHGQPGPGVQQAGTTGGAPQALGEQGRHRRPGGGLLSNGQHDRPEPGDRRRAVLPLGGRDWGS